MNSSTKASASSSVKSRGDVFASKIETKITCEQSPEHNPYHVNKQLIHGYDHLDLLDNCNFADVIYLLLRGNLPSEKDSILFNKLALALINPGPRHPAAQASITAGVGNTDIVNILPIALGVYGGTFDGAGNMENTIRFFRKAAKKPVIEFEEEALNKKIPSITQHYGDANTYANILLDKLKPYANEGKVFSWLTQLQALIYPKNIGATKTSIAAAVMADLGFQPRQGAALMQLLAAPGLLAHGLEFTNKPVTAMLFEPDETYHIEPKNNE
ncbi:MAG: citrate synthase [Colwellia sp.]|nr:citrate synthase [Colwellia sp.]